MGKWRLIKHNGARLRDLGILPDGTLHNPNGYPDDIVRAAVLSAEQQQHERRSRAAKQAAQTRHHRRGKQIHVIANKIVQGGCTGPRHHCSICGRGLSDPPSIARGIGSECWQDILAEIDRLTRAA